MPELTMVQALNQALRESMTTDQRVLVFGEDVGRLGGVFRVTAGLQSEFGDQRVFDTPVAESGIVGLAVGLAMAGWRPVPEIQFDGFSYLAMSQLINHAAKMNLRSRGQFNMPLTIRIASMGGIGAPEHHSDSPEAYFAHTAGLKVVIPSGPIEAYGLLKQSIEDPDPVVFLEPKARYWIREEGELQLGLPIGKLRRVRSGKDATLVSWGAMVAQCLNAAQAASEDGVELEVLDLRSLVPLDTDGMVEAVRVTGRAVVVHEAPQTAGFGAEVVARLMDRAFSDLKAPVVRVTGYDTPYPPAKLEHEYLPDLNRILLGVQRVLDH